MPLVGYNVAVSANPADKNNGGAMKTGTTTPGAVIDSVALANDVNLTGNSNRFSYSVVGVTGAYAGSGLGIADDFQKKVDVTLGDVFQRKGEHYATSGREILFNERTRTIDGRFLDASGQYVAPLSSGFEIEILTGSGDYATHGRGTGARYHYKLGLSDTEKILSPRTQ